VVESYKTYDDNSLVKTADIGQVKYPSLFVWIVHSFVRSFGLNLTPRFGWLNNCLLS
jgi:hypothetical protein